MLVKNSKKYKRKDWKIIVDNKNERYKLLKKNAIITSEGIEDELVAHIFEIEDFYDFIKTYESNK